MKDTKSKYQVAHSRLVYAFPGCGKTTFMKYYADESFSVIDTDDILKILVPNYVAIPAAKRTNRVVNQVVHWLVGQITRGLLLKYPHVVILTNLWGTYFSRGLGFDKPLPIGFSRRDASYVKDVVTERAKASVDGQTLSLRTIKSWLETVNHHGPQIFRNFIYLEDGEFLLDVLSIAPELKGFNALPPLDILINVVLDDEALGTLETLRRIVDDAYNHSSNEGGQDE